MAEIVTLATAAAHPIINPKRMGRRARGGKVTLACDLANRRSRKARGQIALAPAGPSAAAERLRGALSHVVEYGSLGLGEAAMRQLYASTKQLLDELRTKEMSHG